MENPFAVSPVVLALTLAAAALSGQQPPSGVPAAQPRGLLAAPAGDTIAVMTGGTLEPISTSGDWVRVRVEGWVRREDLLAPAAPVTTPSLAEIRADPEGHQGARIRWSVQSLGVQRADSLRSDMELGQPFLLVRDPGGEAGLVYVLLRPDQLAAVGNLAPLQRIEIVASVRLGSSPLTGHPIVELLEMRVP